MNEYEEYLLKEYNYLHDEYPALVNTAKHYDEGFNVVLAAMERRTKADKKVLKVWLKQKIR